MLLALALEKLPAADRKELLSLLCDETCPSKQRIDRVGKLYQEADVFDQAHRLVDKYQQRAEAVADEIEPEALRRLFYYLIDTVLARPAEEVPAVITPTLPAELPVTSLE